MCGGTRTDGIPFEFGKIPRDNVITSISQGFLFRNLTVPAGIFDENNFYSQIQRFISRDKKLGIFRLKYAHAREKII